MDTPHTPGEYRGVAAYPSPYSNVEIMGIVNKKIFFGLNACMHNHDGTAMLSPGSAIDPCRSEWRKRKRRVPLFLFLSFFILFGKGGFTFPFHVYPLQKDYVERSVPFTIGLLLKGNLLFFLERFRTIFSTPNISK